MLFLVFWSNIWQKWFSSAYVSFKSLPYSLWKSDTDLLLLGLLCFLEYTPFTILLCYTPPDIIQLCRLCTPNIMSYFKIIGAVDNSYFRLWSSYKRYNLHIPLTIITLFFVFAGKCTFSQTRSHMYMYTLSVINK